MNEKSKKIKSVISEKRIKLHYFLPSNRKIWTVVGSDREYWLDPDLDFCSCPGYYFTKKNNEKNCYHLDSLKTVNHETDIESVTFSDTEYRDFLSGVLADLKNN